ncbi:MAG: ATP-binding protein [Eubacteriales bacterium]|nr:ATP-binding protein [Eubacteriales bacterium]
MEETKQLEQLNVALELTDSIINKKYLSFLTDENTYKLRNVKMGELALDLKKHARIYHLRKFVYDTNENFLNKLITVVNVAHALNGTIITSIHSSGDCVDYYIGIVAKQEKGVSGQQDREALLNAFEGTIQGNFGGSEIDSIEAQELDGFQETIAGNTVCSVSVVPSLRNAEQTGMEAYVQGMENLVDSLKGRKYTILTIADPVSPAKVMEVRHGYENIYNYLLPLYRVIETKGKSESISISRTDTENYVKGITEGITRTQSKSDSVNYSNGFNLGVSFILSAGFNHSKSHGTTNTDSLGTSRQTSEQTGSGHSEMRGLGHTVSDSTQVTVENRMIKSMLDKIEKNIERIDECEGYGAFYSATYVLADDKETALNVAGNFASLMKGERSAAQVSAINCWVKPENNTSVTSFSKILKCLKHVAHPTFDVNEQVQVSTTAMVSGPELTVQLGFPKKSVNGLAVIPMQPFGRNILAYGQETIKLGQLYFMGKEEKTEVCLEVPSLASHTFVTGSTGTGKSNAIYQMIDKLEKEQIPFLVVEPAKGEYKHIFGNRCKVMVLGTNDKKTELLKVNPFSFHEDVHILEHIDRLIEIFNVCWAMYAAMPAVLKEALEEAYLSCGWDLNLSENRYGNDLFPTFSDLQKALQVVIDRSAYDEEVKSNYKGSLLTRVRSLTNGLNGRIFAADEISGEALFDNNVIVDLSRVGSMETKSLIMGILVMKLQEYRMSQGGSNAGLKHITVLEEAHNLLKRPASEQNPESSNVLGKSVEMISNAIAEMRTYGEGFIIADQAPGLLDMSVIRNTNTKIILRTPEYHDRLLAGRAAGLNDGQIEEVARLPLGVAAVYQNNWMEPVLCKFDKFLYDETFRYKKRPEVRDGEDCRIKAELVKWVLMNRISETLDPDLELIKKKIDSLQLSTHSRMMIRQYLSGDGIADQMRAWRGCKFDVLAEMVTEVLGCGKEIGYVCDSANSVEEMQDSLLQLQNYYLDGSVSELTRLEVNHCFLKVYSKKGSRELKRYYEWDYQIRHKIM